MELFKYMKVGQAAVAPRHQSDITEPGGSFAEGSGECYPYSIQKACDEKASFACNPTGKSESSWKTTLQSPGP
jgi:hypothetical protein